MKTLILKLMVLSIGITPICVTAGESSSGHPFPAPKAFTLIFHDVDPTSEALSKYERDIEWAQDVLAMNLAKGSLVSVQKRVIPLTKKFLTPEPEKKLFTICAHLTNTELSAFQHPTYPRTLAKVRLGLRKNVRVVETSSCQFEEIQQVYSDMQWADSDPEGEDTTIKKIVKQRLP